MARLVGGLIRLGIEPVHHPQANMVFVQAEPSVIDAWVDAGIDLFRTAKNQVRFVTNFRTTLEEIDDALARMGAQIADR